MGTPDRDNYEMAPQNDRDVEKAKQVEEEESGGWTGLGKEELLQVADTPAWNLTRNILLILFWVTWVVMLIAAIWIVVTVPRCPDVEWFEKNVVYQVNPRSFYDSGSDGVGDLKGLKEKIGHLDDLGVKILYINSIFAQANNSNATSYPGNHIVDFRSIDATLGTKEDFDGLVTDATERSIKVILEFIPNQSSDQHPWFLDSKANATGPRADYYIWESAQGNQVMANGESAWTEVSGRGWYYHSMDPSLPALNYGNEDLRNEITEAMNYWLEEGVDGMVITNVNAVVDSEVSSSRRRRQANATVTVPVDTTAAPEPETTKMMVEATSKPAAPEPEAEPSPESSPTNQPTVKYSILSDKDKMLQGYIAEWREVFAANSYLGKYRLLLTSGADSIDSAIAQYSNQEDELLADFPLNTQFLQAISGVPNGDEVSGAINDWIQAKKDLEDEGIDIVNRWNAWMMSNNDISRVASRCSAGLVNVLNTLLLTLPGTPIVMYGEELGMMDNTDEDFAQLAPMSWNDKTNANFTKGTPWKALDSNYKENNVETLSKDTKSSLELFKALVEVHLEPPVVAGTFDLIASSSNGMAYLRRLEDWPTYLVVINFSSSEEEFEFPSDRVRSEAEVVLSTDGTFSGKVNPQKVEVKGQQAVIFKFKAIQ